jgi:hypothetical protein
MQCLSVSFGLLVGYFDEIELQELFKRKSRGVRREVEKSMRKLWLLQVLRFV